MVGNASAPYINSTVLPIAAHCEQYFNPPGLHPSLRDYIWLEAGTSFGITNNNSPFYNHQSTTNHLVTMLQTAGVSWRSYQEGIPGTNCPFRTIPETHYDPHHNPNVYFDDILSNAEYCISHNRPYAELAGDLQSNSVARYNFITPDQCNDGHQLCAPVNDKVRQIDNWLNSALPPILNSQPYQDGGAVFIAFDEGSMSDGPLPMLVLSPLAKGGGYSNTIYYTHSSMLRTMQTIFGVFPFLRDATNAVDLRDLFLPTAFAPAALTVIPSTIDLGAVPTGITVVTSFTISNAGALTLNGTATGNPPLTVLSGMQYSLAAGSSTNIDSSFPVSSEGPFSRTVIFRSNGGDSTNAIVGQGASAPMANFSAFPLSGPLPLTVNFTDASSGTITNRFWNFGDGSTLTTSATSFSHSYNVAGVYGVSLTASGPLGSSTTNRPGYIVVTNVLSTVTIVASDAVAKESGNNPGVFTLNRTGDTAAPLTVNYAVSGSAAAGMDYAALPGTVTFPSKATNVSIRVTPIDDSLLECPETVIATLSSNSTYQVGSPASATVVIKDNELPVVAIIASDPNASEQFTNKGTFTVTRTGCTNGSLTVSFTVGGTATPGTDYTPIGTSVSIRPGKTAAVIAVRPIDDTTPESAESVIVTLTATPAYQLGSPASATVTIADNDTAAAAIHKLPSSSP